MTIKATSNMAGVLLETQQLLPQERFATAVALTRTAKDVEAGLYEEIGRKWDRPTPFSRRSLFVRPARKDHLSASVEVKDYFPSKSPATPDQVYKHQYFKGQRRRKGIERYAERAGLISSGEWLVPASGARFDAYGNMSRGQVAQMMSQLRLGLDPYAWKSKSARSKANQRAAGEMFWSRGGHLKRGVWMRRGSGVVPVMLVVSSVSYDPTIDMPRIGESIAVRRFPVHHEAETAKAWATAR